SVHFGVGFAPHRVRRETDAFVGHATLGRVGKREILKSNCDHGSGREAHLFKLYAVTNGRWGARASMANRHDDGVALGLYLRIYFGIVIREGPSFQTVDGGNVC